MQIKLSVKDTGAAGASKKLQLKETDGNLYAHLSSHYLATTGTGIMVGKHASFLWFSCLHSPFASASLELDQLLNGVQHFLSLSSF